MPHRIAIGAIFTESNHLCGTLTNLDAFTRTELRRGDELHAATGGVLGGALAHLRGRNVEIVPLIFASACPGGLLTADCYRALKDDLLARLRAALPVDGVLMPLHGAAAVDGLGSLDEDLIAAVRAIVGPAVPVVATLDCHAHVTAGMVAQANALLAWETYPHRDTFTTGERGARLLADCLDGLVRPAMAMAKVPVIVGGFLGSTDDGPFATVMRFTKSLEQQPGVLSTSAFLVQPHLDLPGMGGGGLVVTDGDPTRAAALAGSIARMYWRLRFALEPRVWPPAGAIADASRHGDGTILLLETSDCAGGGACGDSVHALASVADPAAAALCHTHQPGDSVSLTLGHQLDPRWGQPLPLTARIEALTDGRFVYSGGIWEARPVRWAPPPGCAPVTSTFWLPASPPTTGPMNNFAPSAWTPPPPASWSSRTP